MKLKRLLPLFLILAMVIGLAAGCSSASTTAAPSQTTAAAAAAETTTAAANEKIKVGMTCYSLKNEFTVRLSNAAKAKADELGVELEVYDGNYDVNTQISQVESMISSGVNAIILNPQDAQALSVAVDKAAEAGIPVIGVNTRVVSDKLTSYVGSQDVTAGELEMQYIADLLGGKGNIVIIEGPMGQSAQLERYEGITNILKKYPDIKVLATKTANWSRSEAMSLMENWLQSFEQIDAVVAENDEMALGARQAIEAKSMDIPCIGVDGITDALTAVESGSMVASIFQDGWGQGSKSLELAVMAAKGEQLEKEYWIPFEPITKDNVAEFKKRAQ